MKKIYKMSIYCGRMGKVESIFISEEKDIIALIGKQLYFGEILGKHSEIYGKLEADDITVLSEDQKAIDVVEKLNILPTGYCPFWYHTCESCGDTLDPHIDSLCKECDDGNK